MGWKKIKAHYRIAHIVHMRSGQLCIGSGYIPDIIVVAPNGRLIKRACTRHTDIQRYEKEIEADQTTFRELLHEPDEFTQCIPVYTFADGQINRLACDALGWPNVTHDGQLMYDNQFFADRETCIKKAIDEYAASISMIQRDIASAESELLTRRIELAKYKNYVATLKATSAIT